MNAYVAVQISGARTERVLERMRVHDISIYELHRLSDSTVSMIISAKDFKRLRTLMRGSACKVHIVRRIGAVFPLQRFFRRYALWSIGLGMFCLFLFASTRILWIDIDGCSGIAEQTILRALEQEGIYIGASRKGHDFSVLNNRLRLYDDRIAWIGLSLNGAILKAEIVESIPTTDEMDPNAPAAVVAQKSGRIVRIEADAGRAIVQIGDAVSAGDILIAGDLTSEESQYPVYAHAAGRVYAEVVYTAETAAQMQTEQLADSGNVLPYREVRFRDQVLFNTKVPYENCVLRDPIVSEVTDTLLPLYIVQGTCCEQILQIVKRSEEEMMEAAIMEAEQLAYLKVPKDAKIIAKNAAWIKEEGQIFAVVTIKTEESIGLTKEIDIDGTNGTHQYHNDKTE